jgi:cell division septation protein DedD
MTLTRRVDALVERGAGALEGWARDLAVDGGFRRQVAEELIDDAAFLRKLAPTKIAARARGENSAQVTPEPTTPESAEPGAAAPEPTEPQPAAAPEPLPDPPRAPKRRGGGPNPFAVVGIAFVAGIAFAKLIDWRGHAFPRR